MNNIHYITYADGNSRITGLPYSDTQNLLVNSISSQTKRPVKNYILNLEEIKKSSWWDSIKNYPTEYPEPWGRDGLYCAYKVFPALELIETINDGDFVYYTDSSAYFREPFTQNIDRLFDYVETNGHVCGSVGNDFKHNSFGCCDNIGVWHTIWPEAPYHIVNKPHILASWYVFQKNKNSIEFIKEWAKYFTFKLNNKPLCTYHHTVDQSVFNILCYKYNMKVFFNNTNHDFNKNANNVHRQLNAEKDNSLESLSKWFFNCNDLN
jgi:hypothetical protein